MAVEREKTDMPVRILLVNLHSSYNAGDDALTQEALRLLETQFPNASFTLALNDPDSYRGKGDVVGSFTSWVKPIGPGAASPGWRKRAFPALMIQSLLAIIGWRLAHRPWYPFVPCERRALLDAYCLADMVISTAGNFLYTSGTIGLPFFLSLFTIYYGWLMGKPVYALPQTLGPIHRRRERLGAKYVLSKTRLVMIRDPISVEEWRSWNVRGPRWALVPDLAFACSAEKDQREASALLQSCGVQEDRGCPRLGVTLVNWGAQSRAFDRQQVYEKAVEAAIRDFIRRYGGRVVLFAQVQGPTAAEDDRIPARRVLSRLEDVADRVALVDRRVPPSVLKAAYGQMDIFLGTRLHSNIFALTEGVPVVAIGYQYKTRGVMRMLELERWQIDIEQVSREALLSLLHQAWEQREHIRAHIEHILPKLREQASRAGELVASDFRRLGTGTRKA